MRAMKFKIARSDLFVAIATQSQGVDLLNKTLKTITITCLQLIPLYRPYRCCVLSKNVSQLLFQLLSWSEDNTKALVRFFGFAHQRYDYTWFIVLIVFVFLVICKTRWKATSTLKRISAPTECCLINLQNHYSIGDLLWFYRNDTGDPKRYWHFYAE